MPLIYDGSTLIYKGFRAQEIYQSLVKMSWNDNQPGLGQAICYLRAKGRRDSPLFARSGLSLSGNLPLTNICYRMCDAEWCFSGQYHFVLSLLSETNTVFHCWSWIKRWFSPVQGGEVALVPPAKMDQTKSKEQLSCIYSQWKVELFHSETMLTLMSVTTRSENGVCDGLFDKWVQGRKFKLIQFIFAVNQIIYGHQDVFVCPLVHTGCSCQIDGVLTHFHVM